MLLHSYSLYSLISVQHGISVSELNSYTMALATNTLHGLFPDTLSLFFISKNFHLRLTIADSADK